MITMNRFKWVGLVGCKWFYLGTYWIMYEDYVRWYSSAAVKATQSFFVLFGEN